jgi:hypothetical protein
MMKILFLNFCQKCILLIFEFFKSLKVLLIYFFFNFNKRVLFSLNELFEIFFFFFFDMSIQG